MEESFLKGILEKKSESGEITSVFFFEFLEKHPDGFVKRSLKKVSGNIPGGFPVKIQERLLEELHERIPGEVHG